MTTLFEEDLNLGGDPRAHAEFDALGSELAKLNHPACPDVDWTRVEHLCLTLFRAHGVEFQSAAAFALARAQLHGIEGMCDGLCLLNQLLIQDGDRLWPPAQSARLEILSWLFTLWQPLLRREELTFAQRGVLSSLDGGLKKLSEWLDEQVRMPFVPVQAFRKQLHGMMQRLASPRESSAPVSGGEIEFNVRTALSAKSKVVSAEANPGPSVVVLNLGSAERVPLDVRRRTFWPGLFVMAIVAVPTALLWWWGGIAVMSVSLKPPPAPAPKLAELVRLDSLLLFPPDSAELKSGSTKVLINGLINIKSQPGWLIVITGHSDATGNSERNVELSRARAEAVKSWMQRMGDIPDDCFVVKGKGSEEPVANNDTVSGRSANRRVDIQLVHSVGACTS